MAYRRPQKAATAGAALAFTWEGAAHIVDIKVLRLQLPLPFSHAVHPPQRFVAVRPRAQAQRSQPVTPSQKEETKAHTQPKKRSNQPT